MQWKYELSSPPSLSLSLSHTHTHTNARTPHAYANTHAYKHAYIRTHMQFKLNKRKRLMFDRFNKSHIKALHMGSNMIPTDRRYTRILFSYSGKDWMKKGIFTHFNSLWPSATKWRDKSGSKFAPIMACCLTEPSHYRNQWWLIIKCVLWHSPENNFISAHKRNS